MAEFPTDGARASHLGALAREREGYEARKKAAEAVKDQTEAERMASRIAQVDQEIARIEGDVPVETHEPAPKRAAKASGDEKD